MQAIRLKTEHLFDPVGVDFVAPRLYWNCSGGRKQTAYQILAADDSGSTLGQRQSGKRRHVRKMERRARSAENEGSLESLPFGMRMPRWAIGAKRPLKRASAHGAPSESPAIIRSIRKSAILWTASAKFFAPPV